MKCPECGTTNEYDFKYCRECGNHLPERNSETRDDEQNADEQLPINQDVVDLWQLYESNELDTALEKCTALLKKMPESASIHSVAALIYERIAENEKKAGNTDAFSNAIKQAIIHYEEILKFNNNSSADKAKLLHLKNMISNIDQAGSHTSDKIKTLISNKKAPLIAAISVFIIVVISGISFFATNNQENHKKKTVVSITNNNAIPALPQSGNQQMTPSNNLGYQNQPVQSTPDVVIQTQPQVEQPQSQSRNNQIERNNRSVPTFEPLKLPAINNLTVQQSKNKVVKSTPPQNLAASPETNSSQQTDTDDNNDASSMLARALELRKRGENQLSIAAAEKAIDLYGQDKNAGKNIEMSNLGIRNAQTIINDLSQSNE